MTYSTNSPKTALIIIDMLNDFMPGGVLPNPDAEAIVPAIQRLIAFARASEDWVVVFSNDSHLEDDPEMAIWGPHAMRGTKGAAVIDALCPQPGPREWEEPKQHYSAFEQTPLAERLRTHGITHVCLVGQHSNCCVRHSAYHSLVQGFKVIVPEDAVIPFNEDPAAALAYLKAIYGAEITTTEALLSATAPA